MKIFIFDIETSPHLSWHWRRWQENIPRQNTVAESRVLCWAGKWHGAQKTHFSAEWADGFEPMMEKLWHMLDEADVVVGFNSDKFDVKRVNSEFLRLGWAAPSPYQKIDLFKQIKKHFAFSSNRLKDLLKELGLTPKLEDNANMELWMDVVYHKRRPAQRRMQRYNLQDVKSTEELYDYMLGWIDPHPNWGLFVDDISDDSKPVCPNCGSRNLHRHKIRCTKVKTYQQWQCQDCGKYARGRKALRKAKEDQGVLS